MKPLITLVFTILFSTLCLAQNGINYKAIIKDANGNVLASSPVSIQFIIYEGAALTNNVYQESHTINTDANGMVIVNIGEGTTANVFTNINWANDDHFLNTKINLGSGLVDMGTTAFKTVPYAINAKTADNVSGLEKITEGSNTGWRLKGQDPNNYGNIGTNAVDLSISSFANTTLGANGYHSTAMGNLTNASGDYSTAMGLLTIASGGTSTSIGERNTASGYNSTAIGFITTANGDYSTTLGYRTNVSSYASLAIGRYNVGGGNAISWVATDPLFEIGNGTDDTARTNALTVLKNGTILAPSFDLAEITDSKALITKEYADTNLGATGLEAINEGNGIGWRLKGQNPNNYGNIGANAVDLSYSDVASTTDGATGGYSIALGVHTVASESWSTAMGFYTTASGGSSTAMGNQTIASGIISTAMGLATTASGYVSTAMGNDTEASGYQSTAFGVSTEASGQGSTAMGLQTVASGYVSTAMGNGTEASGSQSTAFGVGTEATGDVSTTMGQNTTASGVNSTAIGQNTSASSSHALAIGRYNLGGGNPTVWTETDPLFEIGNGTSSNAKANALTVLKNGTITAPSFDLAEITNPKALITKEYADTNLGATGLEAINEGNGIGWRLKGRSPNNYGIIGGNAVDLSFSGVGSTTLGATNLFSTAMGLETVASGGVSTAMGSTTIASGSSSTAMGSTTTASGSSSTAMGNSSTASGYRSTAMGDATIASGSASTAMGHYTTASGENSTAMGLNTTASSYVSLAVGRYNVGGGNATSWVATDPLFEVGFGTSTANKLNALTVTKGGKVGIGTATPSTFLQITNGYDASLTNGTGYFLIGPETGTNMVFDTNEIMVRSNGANANLYLQQDGGNVYVGGTLAHSSDRRLKKDITPLSYGLETILQLNPVAYNWINRTQDHKSLGLIAQEVQPVIGEIVHTKDDEDKTLSVSYTELIPVLIKAIKEQQEIINNQNSKIESLTAESNQKDETLKVFDARLKQIESLLKQTNQ